MKEKFREWKFRGDIKIKFTDGSGNKKLWVASQSDLLKVIIHIVESYSDQNITLTSRQLYYQLVAKDIIPNAEETYRRICTFLTDARYAGLIDWEAIEDRGRVPSKPSDWENISDLIRSATWAYRLPRWSDQDCHIELYCEKQAMESILSPVANRYHVYFGVNKGYSSASTLYDIAQRMKAKIAEGKIARLLYLGDHDPSGLDMIRDLEERIYEFIFMGDDIAENIINGEESFDVVPLALNSQQIAKYKPPPNPAKITDPRASGYIKKWGNKSWELDALEPRVLIAIATTGIERFLDKTKYEQWKTREEKEKEALKKFGESLSRKRK
jgi:hypothetical protein